jgi:hypothetical protein
MILKQLFCKHIWKDEEKHFLRRRKESDWVRYWFHIYDYYALHQKCVKCDKDRIVERVDEHFEHE